MKIKMAVGVVAVIGLMGNAYAATATCPSIDKISQKPMAGGGFEYFAQGPTGSTQKWTGENQQAQESYLKDSTFTDANYKESTKAVICTYEGEGDAGVRVVLKEFNDFKPATNSWNAEFCKNADITKCQFKYSTLTEPQKS
ncbi:DUF3757 domain-containing protein [Pseudomonas sp. A-RE-19]|uniref:DUF3757 domain-containing protein n=1 Tax=Pseudomonas sp. A-RE-19 TaxID=2832401 RepID=UPI001CBE6A9D|nr:DUF3757 domain-containing protein [Pseudomonas sp. A-RE-19]